MIKEGRERQMPSSALKAVRREPSMAVDGSKALVGIIRMCTAPEAVSGMEPQVAGRRLRLKLVTAP